MQRTPGARLRRRFSGVLAWAMWRGVYLGKLPGFERKLRVLLDWTLDLFFSRDIVLGGGGDRAGGRARSHEHDDERAHQPPTPAPLP